MTLTRSSLALSLAAVLVACGSETADAGTPPTQNVVQLAQGNPDLSILVEAVVAADLAATLSAPGPYTVFAPTNAAFAALLTELGVTKAELLANKPLLTAVLQYHVLGARVAKAQNPARQGHHAAGRRLLRDRPVGRRLHHHGRPEPHLQNHRHRHLGLERARPRRGQGDPPRQHERRPDRPGLARLLHPRGGGRRRRPRRHALGPRSLHRVRPDQRRLRSPSHRAGRERGRPARQQAAPHRGPHLPRDRRQGAEGRRRPGTQPNTVQGENFSISAALAITDKRARTANIVATDVLTSNGVIHVIDRVILPAP